MPVESETRSLFGYMKGTVTILGDIVPPINEKWSAIAGDEDEFYVIAPQGQPAVKNQSKEGEK